MIFRRILTFLPRKSREIGRFVREFWLFPREIGSFFREFAPENPAKFCFFYREISEALPIWPCNNIVNRKRETGLIL